MSIYTDQLQKAYIAYFGRPADPTGLASWESVLATNPNAIAQVYAAFAASAEYKADYPASLTDYDRVNAIYNNLFHRDAEGGTSNYWFVQLTAHKVTIDNVVIEVLKGASGTDLVAVNQKVLASNAFTAALDQPSEISGYSGAVAAAHAKAWLAGIYDVPTETAATQTAALNASIITVLAEAPHIVTLGGGVDDITGGTGNDIFLATQATLQLGDTIHGGAGQDKLIIDISGSAINVNGFATDSVETIEVKSLATGASVVDFSDVIGLTNVISNETDGASLTLRDIQSVNDVNLQVIDTDETHNFSYDASAYTAGVETAELSLQEIRGAVINFGTSNGSWGASAVDAVHITSQTVANEVADLNVGTNFKTLDIDGDANLKVDAALDPNLTTVDAHLLTKNLWLDLSNESARAGSVSYTGAQGDNYVTFGSATNVKTITTFDGADVIFAGQGNNNVSSGGGADEIYTGKGNDTVAAGEGNDYVYDESGNNSITAGGGNDYVFIDGTGNNNIDLGAGNDILVLEAKELEVADTITGGAGVDTIELHNTGGEIYFGEVKLSETQQTTSIEVFDLRDHNITLELTDNLIATAQNHSLTVSTLGANGLQTVDITNISAPAYSFTLEGGENRDVVIADDQTVNSMSTMHFGDGLVKDHSDIYWNRQDQSISVDVYVAVQDTLVVVDGASISATDTGNITGLERIELRTNIANSQTWTVDITDALLDQTTDVDASRAGVQGTVTISVDPNVPAGSKLYLNTVGVINSEVDLVVERNSNVAVYLNGVQIVSNGVNAAFETINAGPGSLIVTTPLNFTVNADSLIGTDASDTFYASTLNQLDSSDYADGLGSNDTLLLGAGVYNVDTPIDFQLNHATLRSIETLTFSEDVQFGVSFADVLNYTNYAINTYNLTAGNDRVIEAYGGHTFNTGAGDDYVQLSNDYAHASSAAVTVDGGTGYDTVRLEGDFHGVNSGVAISDVELVHGYNSTSTLDDDHVQILESNSVAVDIHLYAGEDTVSGSTHADTLWVDGGSNGADTIGGDIVYGNGGNDTISAIHVETIDGGAGNDTITTLHFADITGHSHADSFGAFDTADTVIGGAGDDTINLFNTESDTVVFGSEAAHTGGVPVVVSSGYDIINHFAAGAINPGVTEDVLDVSGLIANGGVSTVVIGDFHTGVNVGADHIGVIWNVSAAVINDNLGTAFSTAVLADHITIADNGEAIIAYTNDVEGDNVASVTLAYVCDTDAGLGQTWEVTTIGTVNFDQLTGLNAGTLGASNFLVG